ncbi:MAG: isocitrate/isopropylmalate dehydrogenase family protein, partial [Clostridiales bacterium]|nr:isocitrate/isopropylmalate dehydrogenase family protein [Clostridiales bacterium]
MVKTDRIEAAKEQFGQLLVEQLKRVEEMKAQGDFIDYKALDQIII